MHVGMNTEWPNVCSWQRKKEMQERNNVTYCVMVKINKCDIMTLLMLSDQPASTILLKNPFSIANTAVPP